MRKLLNFVIDFFGSNSESKKQNSDHPIFEVVKEDLYKESYNEVSNAYQNSQSNFARAMEIRRKYKSNIELSVDEAKFMGLTKL